MRNTVQVALLACSLVAPVGAYAQAPPRPTITPAPAPAPAPVPVPAPAPAAASAPAAVSGQVVSINTGQWLAIGAGAIVGAALLDVVLPARVAYILGGVAGGYLANMWYFDRLPEIRLVPAPKG